MPQRHTGHFQPGHDPRRHTFTLEECRRGFAAAERSIARRYPGCDPHFMMCAMIGSRPLYYLLPTWQEIAGLSEEQVASRFAREGEDSAAAHRATVQKTECEML